MLLCSYSLGEHSHVLWRRSASVRPSESMRTRQMNQVVLAEKELPQTLLEDAAGEQRDVVAVQPRPGLLPLLNLLSSPARAYFQLLRI